MNLDLLQVYNFDKKIRFGNLIDGGYVVADLEKYDCYLSAGIGDDTSFCNDFTSKFNINAFGFDGTINKIPSNFPPQMTFVNKNIGIGDNEENLLNYLNNYNNIFLKMDIEGGEYAWINGIESKYLTGIKQLVIEFHGINDNSWNVNLEIKKKCIEKLNTTHYLVHAHGNNWDKMTIINNKNIPDVIELTFVRKDQIVNPTLNKEKLPGNLDYPNNPKNIDFDLNFYPFVAK